MQDNYEEEDEFEVEDSDDEGEDGEDKEEGLPYDFSDGNMVHRMMETERGEALCKEYAAKAIIEYEDARDSSENYVRGLDSDWRIFTGELPKKKPPFDKMANLNLPMNMENITRLYFRAAGELFGDWSNIFGVVPVGTDDRDVASVLTRHGNWQINRIPDFKRQMHRALLMYYQFGDVTLESFYDIRRKCNRHIALTADDFYVPYTSVSTMGDWSDVPYRGKILRYYAHDLERYEGLWYGVEELLNHMPSWDDEPSEPIREGVAKIHREELPSDGPAPYKLIVHETWCKLPKQPRSRFMRLVVDISSQTLLSMNLHEAPSWTELARHRRQMSEYESYITARAEIHKAAQNMAGQAQIPEGGESMAANAIQAVLPEPPPRPAWMDETDAPPREPEMEPIHSYTHAVCLEPLKGAYGMGFGRIQADINRVANSAVNHQIDAATLENFPPLFVSQSANLRTLKIGPGQTNSVVLSGNESIDDVVKPVVIARTTPSLMDLVKFLDGAARKGIQSPEVLSGEAGKSGETAAGLSARIGEATKQLAVSTRAFSDQALVPVLLHNARLNTIHMPDEEVFMVNDDRENPTLLRAGRSLYQDTIPYMVAIKADLSFVGDTARVADADAMVAQSIQDPYLQGNAAFAYEARKRALIARGQEDMVPLLGPAPPVPAASMGLPPPAPPQQPGQEQQPQPQEMMPR